MLKRLIIISFSFLLYFNLATSADLKIVFVDIDKIINESIAGKQVNKKLKDLNDKNIKKFQDREKKLTDKEKDIIKQKNILSKDEFEKKVKILKQDIIKYKNEISISRKDLDQKRLEATKKILDILNTIFSEYSSKNSISLIMQKKNIIIGMSDLDITSQILEIVNSKIKSVKLN